MLTQADKYDILNSPVKEADFLCQNTPLVCEREHTVFLTGRRTRGFLLGETMYDKIKYMKKWRLENKERIKIKRAKYKKEYYKLYPWKKTYKRVTNRCRYDKNHPYYKKGIKCLITIKEIEILWFRDKAYLMKKASIDRIKRNEHYKFRNCRFIEIKKNIKGGGEKDV